MDEAHYERIAGFEPSAQNHDPASPPPSPTTPDRHSDWSPPQL